VPSPAKRLYLVTDRRALGRDPDALERLVRLIGDAAAAGIDLVQIRERDLTTRDLVALCRRAREAVRGTRVKLLVNDRLDVALAARLDGVHLTTRSLAARVVRETAGASLLVGVSTHSRDELEAAAGFADFAVCGPVFETPSKAGFGDPLGPAEVARLAAASPFPVLALGGISRANAAEALAPQVAGIAAIRLFQDAWLEGGRAALASLAGELRALG
jgi:thiamine-phosphate pyrophosphorylase